METDNKEKLTLKEKATKWYRSLSGVERIGFIEKHYQNYSLPYSENQMVQLYKKEFKND